MSNEIAADFTLTVVNAGVNERRNVRFRDDQATPGLVFHTQTIPTSDTVIGLTGITTPKWAMISNLDTVNYVDIGSTVAGAIAKFARLDPGKSFPVPLFPGVVLRAQAHTAAVPIALELMET
jgi:hypothetical protein